jgi:hypothetical protein
MIKPQNLTAQLTILLVSVHKQQPNGLLPDLGYVQTRQINCSHLIRSVDSDEVLHPRRAVIPIVFNAIDEHPTMQSQRTGNLTGLGADLHNHIRHFNPCRQPIEAA